MISIYEIDRILKKIKTIKIIIFPVERIIIHSAIVFTGEYAQRESWSSAISNASDIFRDLDDLTIILYHKNNRFS
ncbi:MAG: hypothetical protein ACXWEW_00285 [Nitrososphaeraceae archaeon]